MRYTEGQVSGNENNTRPRNGNQGFQKETAPSTASTEYRVQGAAASRKLHEKFSCC